jgi:hypothetical protein
MTLKIKVKVNGSTDLNEIQISCVEYTQLCVQKDLFTSVEVLKIKIFSILIVNNRHFTYN